MPRAHLSKRLPDAAAIQLFAEHHIVQVRRRKNGEIVGVKHATFGWMSTSSYYGLQKIHDALPMIQEFIQGGYRLKAGLWTSYLEVDVLGSGVKFPLGPAFVIGALALFAQHESRAKYYEDLAAQQASSNPPPVGPPGGGHKGGGGRGRPIPLAGKRGDGGGDGGDGTPEPSPYPTDQQAHAILVETFLGEARNEHIVAYVSLLSLFLPYGEIFLVWQGIVGGMDAINNVLQAYEKKPLGLLYWGPLLYFLFGAPPV